MSPFIRKATIDDLGLISGMQVKLALHERRTDKLLKQKGKIRFNTARITQRLITSSGGECFIAEIDHKPVGMCLVEILDNTARFSEYKKRGYISEIYVKSGYRRQGIGTRLMEEAIGWFKQNGLVDIRLKVFSLNINAMKAYDKMGFEDRMVEMRYKI